MLRPRLKSRTGCVPCRERRKKCDEARPVCGACNRLQISCHWRRQDGKSSTNVGHLRGRSLNTEISQRSSLAEILLGGRRIADHQDKDVAIHQLPVDIASLLTKVSAPYTSALEIANIHHVLISAVLHGWSCYSDLSSSLNTWRKVSALDQLLLVGGHGKVARMAYGLLFACMDEFLRARDDGTMCPFPLPHWYVPRSTDSSYGVNALFTYAPWPAMRQKMMAQPRIYNSDRFVGHVLVQGVRFLWPYDSKDAVVRNRSTQHWTFSEEFLVRVSNIRSFALAKDFLDLYPEFRGHAPQFEASLTLHEPEEKTYTEALYWRKVQERARQRQYTAFTVRDSTISLDHVDIEEDVNHEVQRSTRALSIRDLVD